MRIPTIKPGDNRITTEVPTQPLDPKVASTSGRMLSDFGSGIAEVAGMFEKAQALTEHTKAQNIFETKLMDIEQRASKENDISPQRRQGYLDEINSSLSESAKGVSMPGNRDYFTAQMGQRAKVGEAKLYSIFNDKAIDQGKAELTSFLDIQKQKYIQSTHPGELESAILERDSKLDAMANAGFITKEKAAEEKIKLNKDWAEAHINYAISTDPQGALNALQQGDKGFYAGVTPDIREKFVKEAQGEIVRRERLNTDILNTQKVNNRFTSLEQIASGKFDWANVRNSINDVAKNDPELGEALQNVVDNQETGLLTKPDDESFQNLVKGVFESKNPQAISEFLVNSLRKENVSKDRLAILVNAAKQRAEGINTAKQNEIDAGAKAILENKNKRFSIPDMLGNFFKGVFGGKSPQEAHTEAIKNEVTKTNTLSTQYKVDDVIPLPDGGLFQITGFTTTGSPKGKKISGKPNSNTAAK